MCLQELARNLAALPDAFATIAEPQSIFLDEVLLHACIEKVTFFRSAPALEDIELSITKRRCNLIFDDLHFRAIADHRLTIFDRPSAANLYADR
jgi:hypothetical protein